MALALQTEKWMESFTAKDYENSADNLFKEQPFILSMIVGYYFDLPQHQHSEIVRFYILIWGYYKRKGNLKKIKITEQDFDKVQNRHVKMLKYLESETDQKEIDKIHLNDLKNVKSIGLFSLILTRFTQSSVLSELEKRKQAILLIGIKSTIECLDAISK